MDNTVDLAHYPVLEAQNSNKQYRFLGIGASNYANYLAQRKIVIDEPAALDATQEVFEDLSYNLIKSSIELAKTRGRFARFSETK